MHPQLQNLIDYYDIPTSNRSSYHSFLWDGNNLALYCNSPLEDAKTIPLPDFEVAHEIAHYCVATPAERKLPEYGNDLLTGAPYFADGSQTKVEPQNKTLQDFRETCAYLLSMYWCSLFQIPVPEHFIATYREVFDINVMDDRLTDGYLNKKYERIFWEAVIWLRENEWIG